MLAPNQGRVEKLISNTRPEPYPSPLLRPQSSCVHGLDKRAKSDSINIASHTSPAHSLAEHWLRFHRALPGWGDSRRDVSLIPLTRNSRLNQYVRQSILSVLSRFRRIPTAVPNLLLPAQFHSSPRKFLLPPAAPASESESAASQVLRSMGWTGSSFF
jgi:hypothetical protein